MYKYETHLHTSPVSRCGKASVRESLEFYKNAGYDGVFITNHFLGGNINIDPSRPYAEKIEFYFSDYEAGLEIGKELGIKVFCGVELSNHGPDFLVYGLDKQWYLDHPEIMEMVLADRLKFMMDSGALVIQAHPFRENTPIALYHRCVHGVEILNANDVATYELAKHYCEHYGLLPFAGSDNHTAGRKKLLAGICCRQPIESMEDFIEKVRSRQVESFPQKIRETSGGIAMYMKLKDGKSKVLTLSYDDGVVQDIRLMEILNKNGIKATFNINTGMYLPEDAVRERYYGRMKFSEAKALYTDSGHEVAVHGLTHPALDRIPSDEALTEILEDRKNIENQYGTLARGMAYPGGTYSQEVMDQLKLCGICYARTIKSTEQVTFPQNWLEWHPTCHHKNPRLMELTKRFVDETPRYGNQIWMLYVWGHSFEFDNQDNWHIIEEFAQYAGGKEDIWYATNIEIYDYVQAYQSLQTSVDKRIVHNPSDLDVWFAHNKQTYCVKAGQTLYL